MKPLAPTPAHHRLNAVITKGLRDDLKKAFIWRVIQGLPFEEASYWLSKSDTTRGRRAFKVLFGISAERI